MDFAYLLRDYAKRDGTTMVVPVSRSTLNAAADEIDRLRNHLDTLRRYVAIEGQDCQGKFIALAYDGSIIGPMLRDNFDPWEFAESVEEWLRAKIDSALTPNDRIQRRP